MSLKVISSKNNTMACSPYAYINPVTDSVLKIQHYAEIKGYCVNLGTDKSIEEGCISLSMQQRMGMKVCLDEIVELQPIKNVTSMVHKLKIHVKKVTVGSHLEINTDLLKSYILKLFINLLVNNHHTYSIAFNNNALLLRIEIEDSMPKICSSVQYGMVMHDTEIEFVKDGQGISFISSNLCANDMIFENGLDFTNLNIGGLNNELTTIFRKVFASRLLPSHIISKLNINHIKGMILYGPPGTGKTLIARELSKSLKAKSIKIINGPELISSYVGKSEENIRQLFAEADKDMKEKNDGLHVIVFDEFDSLCKRRGESSGVSGDLNDKIVTQLLSKIDGVDSLNNILLIGMTNRIELIDSAILRPGRFEIHIEIGIPNEEGRKQILDIHTKPLIESKCIAADVSIVDIAGVTKNYTGAELEGLVRDARSYAINEVVDIDNLQKKITLNDIKITKQHFERAIASYTPQFGTMDVDIGYYIPHGINHYSPEFTTVCEQLLNSISNFTTGSSQLHSIMIKGDTGAGKTAFSVHLATQAAYPFIKVISNNDMIGMSEQEKIRRINDIFQQAYLSTASVIVLDSIETIVEYYRDSLTGSLRILSSLYNTIRTLIRKMPVKKNHKLLIIANYNEMNEFDRYVDECIDMPVGL